MGESLVVVADPVQETVRRVVDAIKASDETRGFTRFAVAGGSAVQALAGVVSSLPAEIWGRVLLTWVDERRVPFEDPASNRGEAYRRGALSKERPPRFELPLWLDGETPPGAIRRVTAAVVDRFGSKLDVTLLGMGEDGHIASLFPGHPARFAKGPVTTLDDSPKPPPARITLTYELLRTSRAQFMLAQGEAKRAAIERVVSGDPLAPANALPELTLITNIQPGGKT